MSLEYKDLIEINKMPKEVTKIGIYNENSDKVGEIPVSSQNKLDDTVLGEKLYSFGAVADIHLQYDTAQSDFQKALTYFNENENVAFTCIVGDLTSNGTETELGTYKSFVETYSPNTPVYAVTGNHDARNSNVANVIETYTGKPLYYSFEHGNDVFVMMGINKEANGGLFTTEELQWLYETLEANRNKRCFVFQHIRPQDGCGNAFGIYNYDIWGGTEQTVFESLLKHYHNVILFHGHSHLKFYLQYGSDIANYDNIFGCHSIHIPSLAVPRDGDVTGANSRQEIYADSEGYVIDVYENHIVLRGRDFVLDKFIPIAIYQLDTTLQTIEEKTYTDSTGTINTSGENGDSGNGDDTGDSGDSEVTGTVVDLTWTKGVKIDKTTGVETTANSYGMSQLIAIEDGRTYTATATKLPDGTIKTGLSICYYDVNGTYLGYEQLWDEDGLEHSNILTPLPTSTSFKLRLYYPGNRQEFCDCIGLTYN